MPFTPDNLHAEPDRRRQARAQITRPAKVYHAGSARYLPAYVRDYSDGGALLEIETPRDILPGDGLDVLVAWNDRSLLSASRQRPARVVRVLRTASPRQYVAVEFAQGVAATRRAA